MFLEATLKRNPRLAPAAAELHARGAIPPNSYVIDLDMVANNARIIAQAARGKGLVCYQMTKQFGRNPLVAKTVAANGIEKIVAVDIEEARLLHHHGLRIGHLGHLVQIPLRDLPIAMEMEPDLVTVFGLEQAEAVSGAARLMGRKQRVLLRVVGKEDFFYPSQEGGVLRSEVVQVAEEIASMDGVALAGVTSFPCILWNPNTQTLEPTPNLMTLAETVADLQDVGLDVHVLNAPGSSCCAVLGKVVDAGATQIEPGSSLTGHTPLHSVSDEPETPAMVYVTEVTHTLWDRAYTLGGGFYARGRCREAVVFTATGAKRAKVIPNSPEAIDYYGALTRDGIDMSPGDSVVYAFRSQVFTSRSFVAVVKNVDLAPEVIGIFNHSGNRLGSDRLPIGRRELAP